MSTHSLKTKRRHGPDTHGRTRHQVGHITFEVCVHPEHGATFALIAEEAFHAKDRRPLFTGHVSRGMGSELRRLAHVFDELEEKL